MKHQQLQKEIEIAIRCANPDLDNLLHFDHFKKALFNLHYLPVLKSAEQ